MKRFYTVLLMVIMMSVLSACADDQESNHQESNLPNTNVPTISYSEDVNLENNNPSAEEENPENNSQSPEQEENTEVSIEDIHSGETYWISGSTVNFRKTPGTDGEVLAQLTKGTEIIKIEEEGDWLYISYGEIKGYVHRDYASSYPPANPEDGEVSIVVKKAERQLELWQGETLIDTFSIGLGFAPEGQKQMEGDGKTPEGEYYVCVRNSKSSFYLSLGVSYPNKEDAAAALLDERIDKETYERIVSAIDKGQCPDWYTPLGGEIMIHGCGGSSDWTRGCIAVDNEVMDLLFDYCPIGTRITILP